MIVGVIQVVLSISKIMVIFDISRFSVSHVYWEYLMKGITAHCEQQSNQLEVHNDYGQNCLLTDNTSSNSNAGDTKCISSWSVQHTLVSLGYGSRRPTRMLPMSQYCTCALPGFMIQVRHQTHEAIDSSCQKSMMLVVGGGSIMVYSWVSWST